VERDKEEEFWREKRMCYRERGERQRRRNFGGKKECVTEKEARNFGGKKEGVTEKKARDKEEKILSMTKK
jgi:hypothetical protein